MKQTNLSVKLVKIILLTIGLFLIVNSSVLDELSSKDPNTLKFSLGMLLVIVASLRRIRQTIRETF